MKKFLKYMRKINQITSSVFCKLKFRYAFPPNFFYIAVTKSCSLKCKMCDWGGDFPESPFTQNLGGVDNNKELHLEVIVKLFDEISWYRPSVNIIGAEPLEYSKIIELIDEATLRGMETSITTNGVLLNEMSDDLIFAGLKNINISINGTQEVHDKICGEKGLYNKVVDGIKNLEHLMKKYKTNEPIINIVFTISNHNYWNILDTVHALRDLNYNNILINHFTFISKELASMHNEKFPNIKVGPKAVYHSDPKKVCIDVLFSQLEKLKKYNHRIHIRPVLNKNELEKYYKTDEPFIQRNSKCICLWTEANINVSGDVIAKFYCPYISFGNIKEKNFFLIWNASKFRDFRKLGKKFPVCYRCPSYFT